MELIISNASSKPIYEQITGQIKAMILSGELAEGEQLPSIRALANSLRVSAITTKRAYADLEADGFIETVQGKGSFVAGGNAELIREEQLRQVGINAEVKTLESAWGRRSMPAAPWASRRPSLPRCSPCSSKTGTDDGVEMSNTVSQNGTVPI